MYLTLRRTGPISPVPLVLLHALPLDSSMWDSVRDYMPNIDVVSVDGPGCGTSPSGAAIGEAYGYTEPSIAAYVSALTQTLRSAGIDKCVLGGLSMGGAVAGAFTLAYPELVAGLALMDTNINADPPGPSNPRLQAISMCSQGNPYGALEKWPDTMLSPAAPDALRKGMDSIFRSVRAQPLEWLQRAMLGRSDCRSSVGLVRHLLLVRGSDDPTCTPEILTDLAKRHDAVFSQDVAIYAEVPQAGHFVANEQPAGLARVLEAFYLQVIQKL